MKRLACTILAMLPLLLGADWPTWRYDASRSAASPEVLAKSLKLEWEHKFDSPRVAWPEDARLQFDASIEPILANGILYVASSRSDRITAFDVRAAETKWVFYADGPIRFAPIAHKGRLYFGADDGNFYCLDAARGTLIWKFPAAPGSRRAIGNERLVSVWPVRGGPVLHENKIHFTVGVWPFEGNFLYSLDLSKDNGKLPSFKVQTLTNLLPQGYLVASGQQLFLPCGRGSAARMNIKTRKFKALSYQSRGKTDYHVSASSKWLFHGDRTVDTKANKLLGNVVFRPVTSPVAAYGVLKKNIVGYDLKNVKKIETVDRRGKKKTSEVIVLRWKVTPKQIAKATGQKANAKLRVHIQAGQRIYGSHGKTLFALDLPTKTKPATFSWIHTINEPTTAMLAGAKRLFVVGKSGLISCFGVRESDTASEPAVFKIEPQDSPAVPLSLKGQGGYALITEGATAELAEQLIVQTKLNLVILAGSVEKADTLRRRLDRGHYGTRISVLPDKLGQASLPPYFAVAAFVPKLPGGAVGQRAIAKVYRSLRPYGGTAFIQSDRDPVVQSAKSLAGAKVTAVKGYLALHRSGALPGSSDWTHEYADPSNTLMSRDRLVKAPLGVLWFGGDAASNDLFFNRHYWSPSMAVIEGRMFMHGPRLFAAVDVYTGRLLWKLALKKGTSPGRRGNFFEKVKVGYHYVATKQWIYLSTTDHCKLINPATGKITKRFKLPAGKEWGRMRVWKNLLIVSAFEVNQDKKKVPARLIALNRMTGKIVWQHKATFSAPVVAIGKNRLYYFDGMIEGLYDDWKRKGKVPPAADFRYLKALDVRTGKPVWEKTTDRIVTWLAYSKQHDVLVASNKKGMDAFGGKNGKELWKKQAEGKGFKGHPENLWDKVILWNDRILDQRGPGLSYNIRTGKAIQQLHPITGLPVPWEFTKIGHHCNYAVANPHMMTFRAGTAGFLDMTSGGTGRLNGFRSGCRNSLIPANGVLNAPNYAHGCVCSYNVFTSLALVHVPEAEMWTYSPLKSVTSKQQVARVGINFGAPGDRKSASGTTWLDYPSVGGPSPNVKLRAVSKGGTYFRLHSTQVNGDGLRWVGASGLEGVTSVHVPVDGKSAKKAYAVKLYFLEPNQSAKAGDRVFDVQISGQPAIKNVDIARQAGGARRLLVKTIPMVNVGKQLNVTFVAKRGKAIICGVEVVRR